MIKKTLFTFFTIFLLSACQTSDDQVNTSPDQVACTKEAKLCPDGSSVGRTGPNCEFETCPEIKSPENSSSENTNTEGWKSVTDKNGNVSFKYPDPLPTLYTSLLTGEEFHPRLTVGNGDFSCEESKETPGISTQAKALKGQSYCVKTQGDAAAGSAYNTYTYSTTRDDEKNNLIALTFTLQQVNCGNYDELQKSACEKEQKEFNPDDLAVQILDTVSF